MGEGEREQKDWSLEKVDDIYPLLLLQGGFIYRFREVFCRLGKVQPASLKWFPVTSDLKCDCC